jgi:hypothetical protein
LNFNLINLYFKSHVLSRTNGIIQDITFKFRTRLNTQLIYVYYYAPRKKRWLFNHPALMCDPNLLRTFNIEFYIDFDFLFLFLIFSYFFFFSFFPNFVYISWKFVTLYCYALLIWEIWSKALIGSVLIWQSRLKIQVGPVQVDASTQTEMYGPVWSGFRL